MFRFLSSFWFLALLTVAALSLAAGFVVIDTVRANRRATPPPPKSAKIKTDAEKSVARSVAETIGQPIADFTAPPPPPINNQPAPPSIPDDVRKRLLAEPEPLTLISPQAAPAKPEPKVSSRYAPAFRMIPVKLVTALDSANIETPIVAITLEDLKQIGPDGISRVVIPAGVEVHGKAMGKRMRDRIDATGAFTFVWRTQDDDNGLALTVDGVALARDLDTNTGIYGAADGSAGIPGEVIDTTDYTTLRALAFASGFAQRGQATSTILNALTGQTQQVANSSLQNAGLNGLDAVLQLEIERIKEAIQRDGSFVRVPAGREFYIYTKETVDLRNAVRGGTPVQAPTARASLVSQLSKALPSATP